MSARCPVPRSPFDGTRDHRDIRTFYTSELAYLVAMRQRYSCQFCGTSSMTCPGCAERNERIASLETLCPCGCGHPIGDRVEQLVDAAHCESVFEGREPCIHHAEQGPTS